MNSSQIRNTFLDFFNKNNHKIVHSSPLVPENDPTLMFANSGMVQFKNIFTGKETRDYKRAVTAQKCVRAGGKHNDLENVGYTTRHHTFFEMLGNFSFGDYFKDYAIELSWNLITKEFGIDKNKLLVTVFSEDQEAYKYWKTIAGLPDDKIIKISSSDNFWSMGDTGPCGPCSEIFYDHGDKYEGGPPGTSNEDGDRFIEIWNLVFMQFEQISSSERINLPKPSIDTGMGLERITALLQGTNDNYVTDLFQPLINQSVNLCDNSKFNSSPSHRVIADHLRSSAFLIADGVMPSNEGRGYVLRRIMRRGMRHAHSLGNKDPIFHKLFPIFLEGFKNSYPELERANDLIINTLINEETKFKETVEKGIKILDDEISKSHNKLDGEIAFKLYDTYGFPIDLTQDYLKNKNIQVDINSFNNKMEEQKKRARQNWKGIGSIEDNKIWYDLTEDISPTEFLGYEQNQSECSIISLVLDNKYTKKITENDQAIVILNQTPFYAESGGQVGDTGRLYNDNFIFEVTNTTKIFGSYFLHWGRVVKGQCSINENIIASINVKKRELIKSNHSSTHLLHASLRYILGKHVSQKGSLVSDEKLRFDFNHNQIIENSNLVKIENLVKDQIKNKLPVKIKISDQKKAIDDGAIALFGEKYGDEVRVVSFGEKHNNFSVELCGGTHVNNTSDIIDFKIISQSSVASGIRRIEAISNLTVNHYLASQKAMNFKNEKDNIKNINSIIEKIIILDPNYIYKTDLKVNSEIRLKEIKKIYEKKLEEDNLRNNSQNLIIEKINKVNFIYLIADNYPINSLKNFIDDQKNIYNNNSIILIISKNEKKLSIVLGVTNDLTNTFDSSIIIKDLSKILGGKGGGGRKDLAQGGGQDSSKIDDGIKFVKDLIAS